MPFSFPSRPDQKARRRNSSAKTASQSQTQTQARILPYRDTDNKSIAYAAPKPSNSSSSNTPPPTAAGEEEDEGEEEESPPFSSSSDAEPLVSQQQQPPPSSSAPNMDDQAAPLPAGLSEYDMQHFTATGRPAPLRFRASSLANMAGDMYTVPQLLPKRYTDDSIIPAIITDVIPSSPSSSASSPSPSSNNNKAAAAAAAAAEEEDVQKKKKKPEGGKLGGLLGKLKGGGSSGGSSSKRGGDADKMLKVVYMPRREYQKWFARDEKGCYIGSEEHRRWTEDELEAAFGRYKPEPPTKRKKKEGLLSGSGSGAGTSGALNAVGGGAPS